MHTLLKANTASLVATLVDYVVTIVAAAWLHWDVLAAGITGTLCGGVIHFTMGRHWVFRAGRGPATGQLVRYALVWLGSFLLNAGGMYLFTRLMPLYYITAKVLTSLTVGLGYNYPLQKRFVFSNNRMDYEHG